MASSDTVASLFRFANHKNPAVTAVSAAFVDSCLQSMGSSSVACLELDPLVRAIAWCVRVCVCEGGVLSRVQHSVTI